MNQIQIVFLIVSCYIKGVVLSPAGSSALPDFIKPCKGTDPNLNECATKTANEVIPHLINGYPALHIPNLNPLRLEELKIENRDLVLDLTKVDVHNLKTAKVLNSKLDLKNHHLEFTINVKNLKLKGDYKMSGKILQLPIGGNGPCEIEAKDGDYTVSIPYTLEEKKGVQYAKVDEITLKYDIRDAYLNFENLLSSKKEISDTINKVLNENWPAVLKELDLAIKETISTILKEVLKGILDKVPYMDLWDNEHP